MNPIYDVIIAGAGPGGATCALALAGSGLRVLLLDKESFPRDKICGDALSGKVLSVLRYLDPEAEQALHALPPKLGSWGIRFVAPAGQELDIPFKSEKYLPAQHTPSYVCRRADFDHWLMERVKQHEAAEVREGFTLRHILREADHLALSDGRETLRTRLLVGADGAQSVVARQLAAFRVEAAHHSAGVRAYYRNVGGFHEQQFIELHFLPELLPGYLWIFPLPGGAANVGLGMLTRDLSRSGMNLRRRLPELLQAHPRFAERFRHAELEGPVQGFGLPLGSRRRPVSGERFLLTGDAASLIDPFSGEGIGNAMISGRLAAAHIRRAFEQHDFSAQALAAYDEALFRKIGSELQLSYRMQQLVRYPWLFNWVVRRANQNPSLRTLMTMMFENLDIRRELSRPSFYGRLIFGK